MKKLESLLKTHYVHKVGAIVSKTGGGVSCGKVPSMPSEKYSKKIVEAFKHNKVTQVACAKIRDKNWIFLMRRKDGSVPFETKLFNNYQNGFGTTNEEFWMGLDAMHELTKNNDYKLRIDLRDWKGRYWYAEYSSFSIGPSPKYTLHLEGYSGTIRARQSLGLERYHNGVAFSTRDKLQGGSKKCPLKRGGGWWYRNCAWVCLTGKYYHEHPSARNNGMYWYSDKVTGKYTFYSFKRAAMRITKK